MEESLDQKNQRIRERMDAFSKEMEAEGLKYFVGVLHRDARDEDGGKAFVQSDVNGNDMVVILNIALPTNQDLINLGIWVGTAMQTRNGKKVRATSKNPRRRANNKNNGKS